MKPISKKIHPLITALAVASSAFISTPATKADDYQYIAPDSTVIWGSGTPSDTNWNQDSPWDGTPANNNPTASDTLNLAAAVQLYLGNGSGGTYRTYEVSSLSVSEDADSVLQIIRGNSSTKAILKTGALSVSGGEALSIRHDQSGSIFVEATDVIIGTGSTFYLGDTGTGNSTRLTVDGFTVSGTTTVEGTFSSHFAAFNVTSQLTPFKFGDLVVSGTGQMVLANGISVVPDGGPYALYYQARSLSDSGDIYAIVGDRENNRPITGFLEVATGATSDSIFSGILGNAPEEDNFRNTVLALTISGTGRQTLTGTNTYTGETRLTGGTLTLSGSGSINETSAILLEGGELIQNSSVAVDAGLITWTSGGIGGDGVFEGNLTATGSGAKVLNPGNSPGTLTVDGDLALDAFTTVRYELNGLTPGTEYDTLAVTGLLGLNDAVLELSLGYAPVVSQEFVIASFDSLNGTFAGLSDGSEIDIGSYSLMINYNADNITLSVTAIPEPGTVALFGFSALLLCGSLVRRKRAVCNR